MKKKVSGAISGIALALALLFVLTACEYSVADDQFTGPWIGENKVRLNFSQGRFTKTLTNNNVESGTYAVSSGNITYYRHGFSPETLPYDFSFPRLTIGAVNYYYDSLVEPEDIAGFWMPLPDYSVLLGGSASLIFKEAKSQKGNPLVKEGDIIQPFYSRGKYVIRKSHLPNSTVVTTTTTHMHGADLSGFLKNQLVYPNLLELFDMSVIDDPFIEDRDDWWFSEAEILRLFEDAATRTRNLEEDIQIESTKLFYLEGRIGSATYDLTLEEDLDLQNTMEDVAKTGLNKLSLRQGDPWGMILIHIFARSTLPYER